MVPYSKKFRRAVLSACDANEGTQAVALRFRVSQSWVRRIKQQRRESGQIEAKRVGIIDRSGMRGEIGCRPNSTRVRMFICVNSRLS